MKHFASRLSAGALLLLALSLTACASSRKSSYINYNFVDWEGKSNKSSMQEWIEPALNNDLDNMPQDIQNKLKDRFYLVVQSRRAKLDTERDSDLTAARKTAESSYIVTLARTINAAVDEYSGGKITASKEGKEILANAVEDADFKGFTKVADSWVLSRSKNSKTGENVDTYDVVQIYACNKNSWVSQANKYIQKLSTDNPDNQDLKKTAASSKEITAKILPSKVTILTRVEKR